MVDLNRKVSEQLREARKELGYSQHYVATVIGMSQNNYSRIESGKSKITIEQVQKISSVFGKNILEIISCN